MCEFENPIEFELDDNLESINNETDKLDINLSQELLTEELCSALEHDIENKDLYERNLYEDFFEPPTIDVPVIAIEPVDLNDEPILHDIDVIDDWIDDINPNYDPYDWDISYENNCGSCSLAVFNRLEGNDNVVATANNVGYNEQMESITGLTQVQMSPIEIENYLLEKGPGAHGIVGIDRAEGPGHWFNAYSDGEKVYALDGQTGEIYDWPPNYGDVINWELSI